MTPRPTTSGCRAARLPLLRDLIHERTGVFFDNGRYDALRDRLAPLVVERGFDSFLDYFYLLKYDEGAAEDWGRVIDALAVPETYFWREMDQMRGVVDPRGAGPGEGRGRSSRCGSGACRRRAARSR